MPEWESPSSPSGHSDQLKKGLVETALSDWKLPEIDVWAVFPTGKLASAKARAFANFVENGLTAFDPPDISRT